jgi:branched-chain amino acid transport system substrate-binding protein
MSTSLRTLCLGLATGAALGACSLAVDFSECKSDADCQFQAGQGRCVDSKCVAPADDGSSGDPGGDPTTEPPDPTTGVDTTTTTGPEPTSTGTTAEPTTAGESSETGPLVCALNSECEAALGENHLCVGGACVDALSDECQMLVWPKGASHDKVVVIGSIIPSTPPFDALTLPLQNALQLAIEDYNATTDLPGGNRVAWVACDDQGRLDRALAAAEHLTGTLGIAAIVGPIFSEQVIAVATGVTVPAGAFLITPTATNKEITTLADDGLVWRTIASDAYQANAVADRVLDLDTPAVERLALIAKDDAYGNGLASDVTARLMIPLGPGLKNFKYTNPAILTMEDLNTELGNVAAAVWGLPDEHPDTVVIAGTNEAALLVGKIMLLATTSDENPPPAPPRILVTHGAVPALEDIVNGSPAPLKPLLMTLLEGTAPVIFDQENFGKFNLRYKARFDDTDPITASSLSYDAGMVVMFAIAAVPPGDPITGAAIRDSVARLVDKDGTMVSFGEIDGLDLTFIDKAHNALTSGQSVDLKGVSGELDFDLVTGEVRTNVVGWGLVPKQNMPEVPVLTPLRLYVLNPPPAEVGMWVDL